MRSTSQLSRRASPGKYFPLQRSTSEPDHVALKLGVKQRRTTSLWSSNSLSMILIIHLR